MVKLKHAIVAGVAVLIGILAVYYLLPSEEKKVRKQFDLLSQYFSKEQGEDLFSMANRMKNIGRLVAENSEFKIRETVSIRSLEIIRAKKCLLMPSGVGPIFQPSR